jgi:hypothetical protein
MFLATIGIVAPPLGFLPAGTFISSQCVSASYNGVGGPSFGLWGYEVTRANGSGGTYATVECDNCNGCYHTSGLTYYSNMMDIFFQGPYGLVGVGTSNYSEYADGNGGSYSQSNNSYNAGCDGTYATQSSIDGATGAPMTTEWKIDCSLDSYYTVSILAPGYVVSEGCAAVNMTDSLGVQWSMVPVNQQQITDGSGGYYYVNQHDPSCGPYPNGYAINYGLTGSDPYIYYLQGNLGTYDYYYYAFTWEVDFADGTGGSYTVSGTTNYHAAGYVFYTHYDAVQSRNVFYHFDGVNGYYETHDGT